MAPPTRDEYETTVDDFLDNVLGRLTNGKLSQGEAHGIIAQAFSRFFKHDHDVREQVHNEMQAVIYLAGRVDADRT